MLGSAGTVGQSTYMWPLHGAGLHEGTSGEEAFQENEVEAM